jgi:hypothetical protein
VHNKRQVLSGNEVQTSGNEVQTRAVASLPSRFVTGHASMPRAMAGTANVTGHCAIAQKRESLNVWWCQEI